MRAGLSTIQQTLTPEAAAVLNRSIAEAARRGHGQTTPLHVAATLLSSPSGLLRQACVRSHPTSSHPLQCRALELCFSVALDRLPTNAAAAAAATAAAAEPPISNALMAALKRAQAHQRRGCPEQQQQPLLAVKVELEQLVVSILDDPSVSRVMREASFSSPAVKSTIEQSISIATAPPAAAAAPPILAARAPVARSLYMNPRLNPPPPPAAAAAAAAGATDAARVLDIMLRSRKRNPVLVADADLAALMREVVEKIEGGEAPPPLKSALLIRVDKELLADRSQIPAKVKEMSSLVQSKISESGGVGVVLDLGDLKWLVESPGSAPTVTDTGRAVVAEMAKLVARFGDGASAGGAGRVWIVGTATCATYLRCQVYHPTMENDWDIQAVPIAPRSKQPTLFQRLGGNGILSSSIESLNPSKSLTPLCSPLRHPNPTRATQTLCSECMASYERELAGLELEKSSSETKLEARQILPHWMQQPKPPANDQLQSDEQENLWKQRIEELQKRWRDTCSLLHPKHSERRPATTLPFPGGYNPATFSPHPSFKPKLSLSTGTNQPKLSHSTSTDRQDGLLRLAPPRPTTPPGSPVKTELVLGQSKSSDTTSDNAHSERIKQFTGCKQNDHSNKQRSAGFADYDSFKRLFKGLSERVSWQGEAASAVASLVMQCKLGNGKPRGGAPKGDAWLLFTGPDKAGKKKMVAALSELMFGTAPTVIHLGGSQSNADDGESSFRGKTSLDRIAEALHRNPFSVVLLEGIDRADMLVTGSIKSAIEKGRLADSQGREVSLGSAIFVLTADWVPEELKSSHGLYLRAEERILKSTSNAWQLELSIGDNKSSKRGAESDCDKDRPAKLRKELTSGALSLDLNLAAGAEEETYEGSRNSSDLTVEHEQETVRLALGCPATSSPVTGLMELVDDTIVFKPVDFVPLRRKVVESISSRFTQIMGSGRFILVDEDAVDRMVGAAWIAGAATTGVFEDWIDRVLAPSMQQLKNDMRASDGPGVVRLTAKSERRRTQSSGGDWLPATVTVAVGGV